MTMINSCH